MDDYREYDGDTMHDMWVDYTYHEYNDNGYATTANYRHGRNIKNGHRAHRNSTKCRPTMSNSQLIIEYKKRIALTKDKIANLKDDIERIKKSIERPDISAKRKVKLQNLLNVNYPKRLARYEHDYDNEVETLTSLLIKREKARNLWTIVLCVLATLVSVYALWRIYR